MGLQSVEELGDMRCYTSIEELGANTMSSDAIVQGCKIFFQYELKTWRMRASSLLSSDEFGFLNVQNVSSKLSSWMATPISSTWRCGPVSSVVLFRLSISSEASYTPERF